MSELTKKRVHWTEYNGDELLHDEAVDVLTSADAVTFDDGEDLQHKYTQGQFVSPSTTGILSNLSTENKSSLVDAINEVKSSATSNESSITSLTNRVSTNENDIDSLETRMDTAESDIDNLEKRVTPISLGGTGATTASKALTNLGITTSTSDLNALVGKSLAGKTVSPTADATAKAATGAEIFNDYRERTFDDTGRAATGNVASGKHSHAEGECTTASGGGSHAEGALTVASHSCAHAEGSQTTASGSCSHAEGILTTASGTWSHAEGYSTTASGQTSHAEGQNTTASGSMAHAQGSGTTASGGNSHAGGQGTKAVGVCSHAGGWYTIANAYQTVHGKNNKESAGPTSSTDSSGDIFIIGNGANIGLGSNAFRVTTAGNAYGLSNFSGSGAGVAELYEWQDGNPDNEDRRGLFVTLDGEKIKIASPADDYILGVIDPCPYVVGDVQSEIWKDMYLKDVFGEKIVETVEVEETTDEFGEIVPAHTEERWMLNPEYDPTQTYISRDERTEFVAITSKGKVVMIDDGTCQVNGYCTVGENGIATASETNYAVRVMERIDDTHIKVYIDSIFINQ